MSPYPKRLIEVDLPIKRISAHARREKSIRHGHISTLHIWWARRPLAACRAVICASLWPDPADDICPQAFRDATATILCDFAAKVRESRKLLELCSPESWTRWNRTTPTSLNPKNPASWNELRYGLLDFIADFANWDASTVPEYLEASRALTQAAHEALGGKPGTRPLVVDPFAGGGSIPLEALRVGADAFASDLNPVAVLLNKVVLEYIPKYGQRLADEVRKWGAWIKEEAEKELAEFYPKDPDGATPIAYLWARTIRCEGPGCGAEVPLIKSLWLGKKPQRSVALQIVPKLTDRRVDFRIITRRNGEWVDQDNPLFKIKTPSFNGTVLRGSATCPCCGYTTLVSRVREQLQVRKGGANDARMLCIVTTRENDQGRFYRRSTIQDLALVESATLELARSQAMHSDLVSSLPDEPLPPQGSLGFRVQLYGMTEWRDLYTDRQLLSLTTLASFVREAGKRCAQEYRNGLGEAVQTCLALALSRLADRTCTLCTWRPQADQEKVEHVFTRQALPMTWDFAEGTFLSERTAGWNDAYEPPSRIIDAIAQIGLHQGNARESSATSNPLYDDVASLFVTDPPYYDAVPYSDLSDFFFVWLKRSLPTCHSDSFSQFLTPKEEECIVDDIKGKDRTFFELKMRHAMEEGRRYLAPSGIGVVVFAHKSTSGWEAQLQAMVDAGWILTGSWPIDTEMGSRLRAMNSAALASSVHLVCRPRENPDGSVTESIGDWRDVLQQLPIRIHEWMPRLAAEGVVGADAIFACLGPALEIFSRYSRVEKASGEQVTLGEYLEQVWAAVAKEALNLVFHGADSSSFEPDARLTAMWFWTLSTGATDNGADAVGENAEATPDDDDAPKKSSKLSGYVLEYDAARKISQGLGIHLEKLESLVQVKGDKARLIPVAERMSYLFDTKKGATTNASPKAKKSQMSLFEAMGEVLAETPTIQETGVELRAAGTVLDRVHQSMLLFAAGRSEGLKRFLVDEEIGRDQRFWGLAQALSALYPSGSDEKRWVDGVLARKKGLGF